MRMWLKIFVNDFANSRRTRFTKASVISNLVVSKNSNVSLRSQAVKRNQAAR